FFQAEDGIRDFHVTGVQTCALPIFGLVGFGGSCGTQRPLRKLLPCGQTQLPWAFMTKPLEHSCFVSFATVKRWQAWALLPSPAPPAPAPPRTGVSGETTPIQFCPLAFPSDPEGAALSGNTTVIE